MRQAIFVRPFTDAEQQALDSGLRSSDAFVLRRCQILLASAHGQYARIIGANLGCDDQTVRNVIHAFNAGGLAVLRPGSSRPLSAQPLFTAPKRQRLRAILHQSPRSFGKPSSVWTLDLAAEVSFAEGVTARQVSGETIRQALQQLGTGWKRAKHWITSPDPAYVRKNNSATGRSAWPSAIRRGRSALLTKSGRVGWPSRTYILGRMPTSSRSSTNWHAPRKTPKPRPWPARACSQADGPSTPTTCCCAL